MDRKNIDKLINGAANFNINLSMFHVEQFEKYSKLLIEWNEKINLTSITDEGDVITKHFLDSLSVFKSGKITGNENIIDIGTGAGFPSIPLKIVFPNIKLTLLDSINKRIVFLEEVIDKLTLENVYTVHGRAEDYGNKVNFREKYDLSVSRAVASLNILAEYCIPFVAVNGYFIAMKGPSIDEELKLSKNAIKTLGGVVENVVDVVIPYTEIMHKLVIIKKEIKTLSIYPRKPKLINKKPL
ncbi:MAG: 16S rRNA (guanine(527)-N(7))-methyltransferase RsmG [Thermoanaerobacteraceae bacterium]|nr:16S rRNA (guanine(527)-N(7))-methyltransferase RsmG [Thermoanaerobacteraceae bacterium]